MKYIGLDIESIGTKPYGGTIWSITFNEGGKITCFKDCYGLKKIPAEWVKKLQSEDYCKVIHSSQMDATYIECVLGIKIRNIWDTDLMETVILGVRYSSQRKNIEPGSYEEKMLKKYSTKLKYTLARYGLPVPDKDVTKNFIDRPLGKKFTREEEKYMRDDVLPLLKLQKYQEAILTRDNELEIGLLENKVSERYHDMKVRGIGFDPKIWRELAAMYGDEFKKRMAKLPRDVSNWNSPAQVKKYFQRKGIAIDSYDELDTVYLATRNKTLGDFIYARELHKAVTSYGLNWFGNDKQESFIDSDGRIRCSVTQIINTGRNSMSEPNLQQLPGRGNVDYHHLLVMDLIRKQMGDEKNKWQHRRAFVPKKGHVFVIGDFSGQEIGVMAAMSDETIWVEAMLRGEDIHSLTASLIDPAAWAKAGDKGCVFPKKCKCPGHIALRDPAKINNFMLAYGGGAGKFAKNTGRDRIDAIAYVAKHKRVIPRLTATLERNGRNALATGLSYSADPYRRRRVLRGEEAWQVVNQGKNNPVQSAGANMLKLAMISLPWDYPIVLVIHDEIICEVPKALANKCAKVLKQVMEKSADYITGIKGLIKVEPKVAMNIMKDD